ncbi:MAG: hypothetical protein AAGI52_02110 [Bacteroidota bacterium]
MFPFDLLVPRSPGRRGREHSINAWIELHNLVVVAETRDDLGAGHVGRIRRQRGIDLRSRFHDERFDLYLRALDWTLANTPFDRADRDWVAAVAETLHLGPLDLEVAHQRAFGIVAHDAIADGHLSTDERLLLHKLQHTLGLDPDLAEQAYDVLARESLLVSISKALNDGALSPGEAVLIEDARSALSVTIPVSLRQYLDKAATRWEDRHRAPAVGMTVNDTDSVRRVWSATWWSLPSDRFRKRLLDAFGHDFGKAGRTEPLRLPRAVFRGRPQNGSVIVTNLLLIFDVPGQEPRGHTLRDIHRADRYRNGVAVEFEGRVWIVDSDDDEALADRLSTPVRKRSTWDVRWRTLRANERDTAIRHLKKKDHTAAQRYQAALPRLRSGARMSEWSEMGTMRLRKSKIKLRDGRRSHTVSFRTPPDVYTHQRLVWLVRPGAQDKLLEFLDPAEAQRFVRELARVSAG